MLTHPVGFRGAGGYGNDFVMVFATTVPAETLTIPCQNAGTFNATIDWGDDSTSEITTYNDADLAHEYADAGDHTVRISGAFPRIYFNNVGDKDKLKEVIQMGSTGLNNMERTFYGCGNLVSVGDMSGVSSITNWALAFLNCTSLAYFDAASLDMSSTTKVQSMFQNCDLLNDIAIDTWDISSMTNIANFLNASTGLITSRYDATLIAWAAQTVNPSLVAVHFGGSKYTAGGAAEAARTSLVDDDLWTIIDGGAAP